MTRGHIGMGALALLLLAPVGAIAKSKPATGEDTMNTSSAAARLDKAPGKPGCPWGRSSWRTRATSPRSIF